MSKALTLKDLSNESGYALSVIEFDLPGEKVNKFSVSVMEEFEILLTELEQKSNSIEALLFVSRKSGNFIAGADINLIQSAKSKKEAAELSLKGHSILNRWEDLPFPKIMAIQGTCLGGGCELSLASDAILMANDSQTRIGLPEVMLGLIPGMGGCVRLPRKIGLAGAFDLILTGKTLSGEKAVKAGLADACIAKENFEDSAKKWVKANLKRLKNRERIAREPKLGGMGGIMGSALEKNFVGRSVIFKQARAGVMSKTKGKYPAPLEAIDVIESIGGKYGEKLRGSAREKACKREAEGFGKMSQTPESKNLIRLFFLTEAVKKSNGLPHGKKLDTAPVTTAGVLGAGVMGGGIAQLFAEKNISARMKDISQASLEIGMKSALAIFSKHLKRRKISPRVFQQSINRIAPTLDYSGFKNTQVVVEAVIEKMEVKKSVFKELEKEISDQTIVASNTSSLSVSEMQTAFSKPERFCGMHFFNPVAKMPLVEVIRGDKSSDEAVATIFNLSKQIGKYPIVVKDAPGFLVNRLLATYLNEASYLLLEGAPMTEIDAVLEDFGMPMGPIELIDEIGVDVSEKVGHILNDAFGERMKAAPLASKILADKRLGKKNGKGLYAYSGKDNREKTEDKTVYAILGVTPVSKKVSSDAILDRCILPMINEAARCLKEKIVETPDEVDLGMIMGTGFPPFRGGLLRYADVLTAKEVVSRLEKLEKQFGVRFTPSDALREVASSGNGFYTSS